MRQPLFSFYRYVGPSKLIGNLCFTTTTHIFAVENSGLWGEIKR